MAMFEVFCMVKFMEHFLVVKISNDLYVNREEAQAVADQLNSICDVRLVCFSVREVKQNQ